MKQLFGSIALVVFGVISVFGLAAYQPVQPAPTAAACGEILGIPAWYTGLQKNDDCSKSELKGPRDMAGGSDEEKLRTYIWVIVLNISTIILMLVGYIAVGYVLYGGFRYLTSGGSANAAVSARRIIANALVGMVVVFASVAIINLIKGGLID